MPNWKYQETAESAGSHYEVCGCGVFEWNSEADFEMTMKSYSDRIMKELMPELQSAHAMDESDDQEEPKDDDERSISDWFWGDDESEDVEEYCDDEEDDEYSPEEEADDRDTTLDQYYEDLEGDAEKAAEEVSRWEN